MPHDTIATRVLALMLALILTGCESSFTAQLWKTDRLHHVVKPASGLPVRVFYAPERKDYLLSYEAGERFASKPRQLYLGENIDCLEGRQKPRYASEPLSKLQPLPVNQGTNVLPAAVVTTTLTIYTEKGVMGPYPLPAYDDGGGTALQVVLTPFAVAGDLAVFCLVLGLVAAVAMAPSYANTR